MDMLTCRTCGDLLPEELIGQEECERCQSEGEEALSPEDQKKVKELLDQPPALVAWELEVEPHYPNRVDGKADGEMISPVQPEGETFDWTTQARPPYILSMVDGMVIGWDTCGTCQHHIRICQCKNGPSQPGYIKSFKRGAEPVKSYTMEDLTPGERARVEAVNAPRAAVVVADQTKVEAAVEEALTPTGRKKRADAGVKRGPRKKGTPDSVAEAAGDLAAAMTKETE